MNNQEDANVLINIDQINFTIPLRGKKECSIVFNGKITYVVVALDLHEVREALVAATLAGEKWVMMPEAKA